MDSQRVRKVQLQCWMVGCFVGVALAGMQSTQAQVQHSLVGSGSESNVENRVQQANSTHAVNVEVIPEEAIAHLSDLERPASTVEEWLAQSTVQITGVQINPTETGFEILLATATNQQPAITTAVIGNALIADIPNAVLALPDGDKFQTVNPVDGIALVTVTPRGTGVRVAVTGVEAPLIANVRDAQNLVLSVTPAAPAAEEVEETEGEEIQVLVTGEQDEGYNPSTATTGTRIEAPLRDVPLTLQVIPRQVIEDRQITRLTELADNVPGVEPYSGYGGLPSNDYYIRGFNTQESFRNGFRDFTFISPRDPANIERVEFLRGPASVLYGGGFNLTGAVNTVTERPLAEPRYEINGTIGSYELYRPTIDFTGPLVEDGSLLYRLNLSYSNADSFRDFNESESVFVAPVLTWNIGPRTTLTTEFEYHNYDYVFDRGFPPGEVFLDLPRDRFLFEPDLNRAQFDSYYFGYNFEHKFNDQWRIRQGFGGLVVEGNTEAAELANYDAPFVEADGRTLERNVERSDELQENFSVQTELIGEFNTGSINHNLLFGIELARYKFAYDFFEASLGSIDIFDPEYGDEPGEYSPSLFEEYGTRNVGVYLQDLIYLTPNLIVLAGGRLDFNDSFYRDTLNDTTLSERSGTYFSPRLGLVYQPGEDTSLYFNWANAFTPNIFGGRSRTGEAFEPERGEQFEIGIKQEFLNDRLSANLALYHITRQNVSTTDPEDPDFSIQTGEQTSRGIELDVTGEILPGWNIIANYALTDAFVSEDNDIPEGDRLAGIPEHTASLMLASFTDATTGELP